MGSPVTSLLEGIERGDVGHRGVFAHDAVLDATVPGWRLVVRGATQVNAQLDQWYADPGRFEEVERLAVPGGEVVRFFLTWDEHGVPHACHQTHLLREEDGLIVADTMFCGGRWPAALLAEMEEAAGAARHH